MRVNCAHDDSSTWSAMIENLRRAEEEIGRVGRVAMDLGGPKIRTGPIEPGPKVIHWQPHRDSYGRVIAAARIWLSPTAQEETPPINADAVVPVAEAWWEGVHAGDLLDFIDAAGRDRRLNVIQRTDEGLWAEATQTTYITPETVVRHVPANDHDDESAQRGGHFGPITPRESFIVLRKGDRLLVTDAETPGRPAKYDDRGRMIYPSSIGCTLPDIFRDVGRGDRILFDDGKIAGVVVESSESHLLVEITRARQQGQRLRADKGINLPDTDLQLPALTEKDIQDLGFVAKHADMVSYSFVRRAEDIQQLLGELQRLGRTNLGIILKIENRQAFDNLPRLLMEVMRSPASGVMIARGDLAVECGWERLAEMQEEILWMCEAAHMPVIWATQVLEGLAKKGLPTRAEVTDAGMGARAECVMLNKGPNIVETVQTLNDILRRMQTHQVKKRATFRRLKMADRLFDQ
jgi:pyruvate kinase